MIRRPPRSTRKESAAASDVYKRQLNLLRQAGAEIMGCSFVVDLTDLGGRRRLEKEGVSVLTLVEFEGE